MTFEEWFGAQLPRLLRFTTVLCGGPDPAEEVLQDVALKALRRWDSLRELDRGLSRRTERPGALAGPNVDGYVVRIQAEGGEPAPLTTSLWPAGRRELLVSVAEDLRLARDLGDPQTWFDAQDVFPR